VRNELAQPLHIASFVNREVIDACVLRGMFERPPSARLTYAGFVDPSGGSVDSFTCAIAHCDHVRDVVLIEAIREIKAPFSPEAAVSELATLLRSYRVYKVHGDKYAGEWPRESFAKLGISYEPSPQPKSGLYSAFLPLLKRVELPDNPRLVSQLCSLERKTARGGRDSIDLCFGVQF
jgi:hypothetical protein